jgi:hypothetical protein
MSDQDVAWFRSQFAPEEITRIKDDAAKATPEERAYFSDFLTIAQAAAGATDRSAIKTALLKIQDMNKNTCTLDVWHDRIALKRAGLSANRWLYNPGPLGLCDTVHVGVLENTGIFWKYTITTVAADTKAQLCKGLEKSLNKHEVYSWDAPKKVAPSCKYLKFGG